MRCPTRPRQNAAILQDLNGGVTSIALQIAGPGQAGVMINSSDDLERALEGVEIDFAPVSLLPGERFHDAMGMLAMLLDKKATDAQKVVCALNADPLGTLARTGALTDNLDQHFARLRDVVRAAREKHPRVTTVLVDAKPYHDGGASEAQELACLCATMVSYLRALEGDGLGPAEVLGTMAFSLAADTDQFLSIAKLRAARILIGQIAEACNASASLPDVTLHAQTSRRMFAQEDPWVNILRTAMACSAAALGGANSITVLPFTWATGLPDAFACRLARNIQIILQEESSLAAVADPAGGSWYVEKLTQDLASRAWTLFQEIEAQGGMAQALASGLVQDSISETATARAKAVATGKIELTGINAYPEIAGSTPQTEPHPLPEEAEEPAITVDTVRLRAPSAPFDQLRRAANVHFDMHGERPAIFLANIGTASEFAARTSYARNFFAAGGIDAIDSGGFKDAEAAAAAFKKSNAKLACICAGDEAFDGTAGNMAAALRDTGALHVYLAGRPGDHRAELQKAGVGTFIHKSCDMLEALGDAQEYLGIQAANAG